MPARKNPSLGKKPDKIIRDALMVAIKREVEHNGQMTKKLYMICDRVVDQACEGDAAARNFIADRIEGKPMQPVDVTEDRILNITIRKFTDSEDGDWDREVAAAEKEATQH